MDQRGFVDFNTPKEKNNIKEMLDNEVLALPSQSDSEEYNDFDSDEDMGDLGDEVSGDEISGDESSDYWSDEKGDGESKEDTGRWGKSKRTYYGTDYVDDEMISSDEEGMFLFPHQGLLLISNSFGRRTRSSGHAKGQG